MDIATYQIAMRFDLNHTEMINSMEFDLGSKKVVL